MATKPNVIIFGGINDLGPLLALHLVPLSGEPLVSHLRIVDKFIMNPPTTYVIKDFTKLLHEKKGLVDYRQSNLTVAATVAQCFSDPAPNSQPYTHIIDLTGEETFDRSSDIFITQTLNVSLLIATEASKHSVKSYLRRIPAFYDQTDNMVYKESDPEGWKPWGTRGAWWHEMLRAVGNIPNLPLIATRGALPYGPGYVNGEITTAILLGLVYKHLDLDMKFLWPPELRKNTIHSLDWVDAIWSASVWAGQRDRATLNAALGVGLVGSGEKVDDVQGAVPKGTTVTVPVVNLVDGGDLTQEVMGGVISKVFDIKTGFQGTQAEQFATTKFEEVVEDVNELHMNEWATLIVNSNPPVPSTPLSPYALSNQLAKHGCALDGEKLKSVVGCTLKYPNFNEDTVKQTIEFWRTEGIWPNTGKYSP